MPPNADSQGNEFEQARNDYRENILNEIKSRSDDIGYAVAIGSPSWEEFDRVGRLEAALLAQYGLAHCQMLVDVGCGSGRLARALPNVFIGEYIGTDISSELLEHARRSCGGPGRRFVLVDGVTIPLADEAVDMVAMFSLLTHLRHEESFLYLREAVRVLRSGGVAVFSFLDFSQESHWAIFHETVTAVAANVLHHVNQFMSRDLVVAWAKMLEMEMVDIHDGQGQYIVCSEPDGTTRLDSIGQSVAIWRKP